MESPGTPANILRVPRRETGSSVPITQTSGAVRFGIGAGVLTATFGAQASAQEPIPDKPEQPGHVFHMDVADLEGLPMYAQAPTKAVPAEPRTADSRAKPEPNVGGMDTSHFAMPDATESIVRVNDAIERGDWNEALEILLSLHHAYPQRPLYCFNIAQCYFNLGDYSQAIVFASKYIESCPRNPQGYTCRIKCYVMSSQHNKAEKDADMVTKLLPDHPNAQYLQGQCKQNAGKHKEAVDIYNKAKQLFIEYNLDDGIEYHELLVNLAGAYEVLGQNEEGAKAIIEALKIDKMSIANQSAEYALRLTMQENPREGYQIARMVCINEASDGPQIGLHGYTSNMKHLAILAVTAHNLSLETEEADEKMRLKREARTLIEHVVHYCEITYDKCPAPFLNAQEYIRKGKAYLEILASPYNPFEIPHG